MKKAVLHQLDTRPYYFPICVAFAKKEDHPLYAKKIEAFLEVSDIDKYMDGTYRAQTYFNPKKIENGVVILFDKRPKMTSITHECFHATYKALGQFVGMPLSEESDEAYAYFIGEISAQIVTLMYKQK